MISGMPGGRQFAVVLSSAACAFKASTLAAHSGVRGKLCRLGKLGNLDLLAVFCGFCLAAPGGITSEVPPPPSGASQTPVKSGNLAIAAQSAAVGVGRLK